MKHYRYDSLRKKTRNLIIVTALGISLVAIIATIMLFGIKNSFDTLFYNRTLSLSKLQNIKDVYTYNIYNTYRDIQENNTNAKSSIEVINISKQNLNQRWNEYKQIRNTNVKNIFFDTLNTIILNTFLTPIPNTFSISENDLFLKIDKNFSRLENITYIINNNLIQNNIQPIEIKENLFPIIDMTNIYLEQLINYHIKYAIYQKEMTDAIFEATFWILFVIIFVIISIAIFVDYLILKNINKLHISLQRQVNIKTKELQILNLSLEEKIKQEIKQSRLKDDMLYQQAKLASMGEMIANIAHQWRQPLNILSMLIQSFLIKNMMGKLTDEFIKTQVEEGLKISKSMSDTIDGFRNYFLPTKEKNQFLIQECTKEALLIVENILINNHIKLILDVDDDIKLFGYHNSLSQVLVNLLNNSNDVLKSKNEQKKYLLLQIKKHTIDNKNFIIIKVIDNGGGIEDKYKQKLFEPYFTTKHKSIGTGIGLYMSKKIIEEQFNGYITAKNIKYIFENKKYDCAMFKIKFLE